MTSFGLPIKEKQYSEILNDYLASRQLKQAFSVLEAMPAQMIYFSRFLHACVDNKEMEMAEKAIKLMASKNLSKNTMVYNLMIRGYGKKGHLEDAIHEMETMEDEGFEPNEETYNSLLDACISANDLEYAMSVVKDMKEQKIPFNLLRMRKLIQGLCLQRNIEDAFVVFDIGVASGVDGDLQVCSDLIDVSKECHMPERVPKVFACMQRRGLRLDFLRSHTLISLLSQVDELRDALCVLSLLPLSAQRCRIETYTHLVGSCFRASLGDEAMRLIKEYLDIAPADSGLSLDFFNYCIKGFRQLRSPAQCSEVMAIMENRMFAPSYETYKEIICCSLEVAMYKQALQTFKTMNSAGFEAEEVLVNAYIQGLAPSKVLAMHNLCWDMFVAEKDKGTRLPMETFEAVFDSCVSHARISRIVEVGVAMEVLQGPQRPMKPKRMEHLRRSRMVLNISTIPLTSSSSPLPAAKLGSAKSSGGKAHNPRSVAAPRAQAGRKALGLASFGSSASSVELGGGEGGGGGHSSEARRRGSFVHDDGDSISDGDSPGGSPRGRRGQVWQDSQHGKPSSAVLSIRSSGSDVTEVADHDEGAEAFQANPQYGGVGRGGGGGYFGEEEGGDGARRPSTDGGLERRGSVAARAASSTGEGGASRASSGGGAAGAGGKGAGPSKPLKQRRTVKFDGV